MKKQFNFFKNRIANILFWSIVSAAFIGPGTVVTATKAGATFHYDLMWAMLFSTFACLLLQEASARITILSGMNLGESIAKHFEGKPTKGVVLALVVGAIILGSAAYETGNILGSAEGLHFVFDNVPKFYFFIGIGIFAFIALSMKSLQRVAKFLGFIVFLMGFAFVITAFFLKPSFPEMVQGSLIPKIPDTSGAGILILGLIGTTVVPYDLFLGSSLANKKQTLKEARFGLGIAIILGGLISMSIMTVGSSITKDLPPAAAQDIVQNFSFKSIEQVLILDTLVGKNAVYIFGFGIFAAGLTSAITAPLASEITAKNIFLKKENKNKVRPIYFRLISTGILLVGLTFGLIGFNPVPAIIAAQAFNGLILPFISVFLVFVINNPKLMGKENTNKIFANILMAIVVWVTMLIGFLNVIKATARAFSFELTNPDLLFAVVAIIGFLITAVIFFRIYRRKMKNKE